MKREAKIGKYFELSRSFCSFRFNSLFQIIIIKRVIHRDLKSDNCLIRRNLTAVVADFGLARVVEEGEEADSMVLRAATPLAPVTRPSIRSSVGGSDGEGNGVRVSGAGTGGMGSGGGSVVGTNAPMGVGVDGRSEGGDGAQRRDSTAGLSTGTLDRGLQKSRPILQPRIMSVVGSACKRREWEMNRRRANES